MFRVCFGLVMFAIIHVVGCVVVLMLCVCCVVLDVCHNSRCGFAFRICVEFNVVVIDFWRDIIAEVLKHKFNNL